ncbi:MAG: helix-turn-helix domain containing protein [Paludibacter sp.]|nr:helix-turn-helix domain containing protein [Paludibacter sp.]
MQNEEGQKIVGRFFEALYDLKARKVIRGKQTFTRKYGINNRNFWLLEQDKSRDILQLEWIAHLVNDFGVSAEWILTGKGYMFKAKRRIKSEI